MVTSRRALFRSPPAVRPRMEHDILDEQHEDSGRNDSSDKVAGRTTDIVPHGPKLTAIDGAASQLPRTCARSAVDSGVKLTWRTGWQRRRKSTSSLGDAASKGAIEDGK